MKNEINQNIIKSLRKFGLTEYESSSYLALNYMITATAGEIAEQAKIPRSRIYEILKLLEKKGFIEVKHTRPSKYTVVPPKEIFRENKRNIISELENSEKNLEEIYENQLSKVPAPVWLIHGPEKIIEKELELISKARKTIAIRMGFIFEKELDLIESKISQKVREGVDVKIMVNAKLHTKYKKVDSKELLKYSSAQIAKFNLPTAKMIIRDEKEMMHIFAKFKSNGKPYPETAIGIWNMYEDIAQNYHERFEIAWNKKSKTNKKTNI
ncbi:MAG: TrmB family transcriptional regulator [Methanobrevibacter sp.]|jgi:sugar-specific transcriptional regulator TrmB|nr:TrmB family transcriptional regulator [Methanobrevibacter sp.]